MSARLWPLATVVFGAATFLIAVAFEHLPSVQAAHFAQGDFNAALAAFQHAQTPADLAAVFGAPPDQAILDAMTAGNRLDLFAFIPAYTLFLACGGVMVAGGPKNIWMHFVIPPLLIACVSDVVETATQLAITANYADASAHLPIFIWCLSKFFGLAAYSGMIAAVGLGGQMRLAEDGVWRSSSGGRRYLLGAINLLPMPATIAVFLGLAPTQLMSLAFGAAWLSLLAVAVLELSGKLQQEPAPT